MRLAGYPRPGASPIPWSAWLEAGHASQILASLAGGEAGGDPEWAAARGFLPAAERKSGVEACIAGRLEIVIRRVLRVASEPGLERLLRALLRQSAQSLQVSEAAREASLPFETARRYVEALARGGLIELLAAHTKSPVRSPVVLPLDPWIAAGCGLPREQLVPAWAISVLARTAPAGARVSHWATHAGAHIDVVVEVAGRVLALAIRPAPLMDGRGLRAVRSFLGSVAEAFTIVLSAGAPSAREVGDRIAEVPLGILAGAGSRREPRRPRGIETPPTDLPPELL